MTGKERVKAATRFETVDRVPTTLLDGGTWIVNQAGCSFDELMAMEDGGAQIVYDCYQKLNSDIVFAGVGCFGMGIRALGGSCDASKRGQPIDVSNLSSDIDFYANYDLSTIRPKLLSDPGIQGVVRQTRRLRELIGDDKYISTNTGAPFSNAAMLWGLQDFMMDLFSDETDLTPLFRFATAANLELNRIVLDAGANMVELGDPVASGALISQDMYEKFALPLVKDLVPQLKAAGAEQVLLHICGNTAARLESLKDTGITIFSLDAVDIKTALETANGHYAIMGNLSPTEVMLNMNAEQVKELSLERCRTAGRQNGGYILAPGCDIPAAVPLDNVLAMVEGSRQA